MFCGWEPSETSEANRHELLEHVATEHLQRYAMLSLPWIYNTTTKATSFGSSAESCLSKHSRNMMSQEPMPVFQDECAFANIDDFSTKGDQALHLGCDEIVPTKLCEELKTRSRDRTTAECIQWITSWSEAIIGRGVVEHGPWEPDTIVRSQSQATSRPIHADLLQQLDQMNMSNPDSPNATPVRHTLPCNNIPHEPNPFFSCRQKEIEEIRRHLDVNLARNQFCSFALWGRGGVGKTQIALAFAHEQVSCGVEAVLWIDCETRLTLARSLTFVAGKLQLEGRSKHEDTPQNRLIVLRWLRTTGKLTFNVLSVSRIDKDAFRGFLAHDHGQCGRS